MQTITTFIASPQRALYSLRKSLLTLAILGACSTTTIVAPAAAHGAPDTGQRRHGCAVAPAAAVVHRYIAAFMRGRFGAMWSLLTPSARDGWGGLSGYSAYYRTKFAPVRLTATAFGAPRCFGRTVQMPASLILQWRDQGPDGVLSLFRNVPVSVVPQQQDWRIDDGGPLGPDAPFIPPLHGISSMEHVPILMYHHISDAPPLADSQVGLTVRATDFAAQLDYLSSHGYHAVRLIDLFNALYYGRPLPPLPIILTFDDGYLDNYTDAFPLLLRHHIVAVFNIITAFPGLQVGVNRYMTWPQIEQMAAAGMEMESHTIDHQDLGLLDDSSLVYELRFSRGELAAHVHHAVQFLTYPSGEPFRSGTVTAQQRVLALLPRYGYVGALLDQPVPSTLQDASLPYQLPRVRVARDESLAAFAASLSS